jgi:hypothetical protein
MDAHGNQYGVSILLLQLLNHLSTSRTVDAALAREVLKQYTTLDWIWLHVNEPVSLVNVAAGSTYK